MIPHRIEDHIYMNMISRYTAIIKPDRVYHNASSGHVRESKSGFRIVILFMLRE